MKHCSECARFDPPKDDKKDAMGYCTQCGENTSPYCPKCFWFTPKKGGAKDGEKEKD